MATSAQGGILYREVHYAQRQQLDASRRCASNRPPLPYALSLPSGSRPMRHCLAAAVPASRRAGGTLAAKRGRGHLRAGRHPLP
ncbi:hypothetical protein C7E25_22380 [Stenotrophomonas maltophilia]|nr:hypothetical protein C7E25_22380 [Stenotrophomonas maltophilia]